MTKKDYELIAIVISDLPSFVEVTEVGHERIALRFAGALKSKNPKFNRNKFLQACGVKE